MPTASTLPFIVLLIVLWRATDRNILAIVLFMSIFDAASALNFGSVGLVPWVASLLLCLLVKLVFGHRPPDFLRGANQAAVALLIVFIVYAAFSSVINPNLFAGLMVLKSATVEPLSWGATNVAQLCYLLAVTVIFVLAATRSRTEMEAAIQWYVRGCLVSALFAIYQLANATMHVPYPEAVLYSNPSHIIFPAYQMNGMWRLSSTFPEASEMAGFMALAVGFVGWELFTRKITAWSLCKFLLLLACALMTFSTTGYLTLAFIVVAGVLLYAKKVLSAGVIEQRTLIVGIVVGSLILVAGASPTVRTVSMEAVRSTVLDKKDSDSYKARTETHGAALETARSTYLLGAGWGSVRPSGLFYVLFANLGIIGVVIFLGLVVSLFWPLLNARRHHSHDDLFERSLFGVSIMLLAMLIAGGEPVAPVLWGLFGIAAASCRAPHTSDVQSAVVIPSSFETTARHIARG